jgi:hypothetical protein
MRYIGSDTASATLGVGLQRTRKADQKPLREMISRASKDSFLAYREPTWKRPIPWASGNAPRKGTIRASGVFTRADNCHGQLATHTGSSFCAPWCSYQMPDRRRAFRLETIHGVLQHPIGIGYALVLSHVVEPGIDAECLDKDTLF